MRWDHHVVDRPTPVNRTLDTNRAGPGWFVMLLVATSALGFFAGERFLPRVDGGDISTVTMTYDQVARSRKAAKLQRTATLAPRKSAKRTAIKQTTIKQTAAAPKRSPRAAIALSNFYAALRGLDDGTRSEPVTIVHLGDSHIASDRFTGDMRELLQRRFGDAGRGMMMPGFPFGYYRVRGVSFSKSSGWTAQNSLHKGNGPYGLSGVKLTTRRRDAWLSLTSKDGAFEWADVAFLTGPGQGSAEISVDGTTKHVRTQSPESGIIFERIPVKGTKLKVRAAVDGAITVLSWAVGAGRPGVRYANFGIPSATADITRKWDDTLMAADLARLDPELIVLGYGTNEGFNDGLDHQAYERRFRQLIDRLQQMAPKADFLVIGPPDGARFPRALRGRIQSASLAGSGCRALANDEKTGYSKLIRSRDRRLARWHPPPKLNAVRQALKRAASHAGAHFWDWSSVMGGACGIHQWAKAEPKLAASDHVHITGAGSRRSAKALYTDLMAGFTAHRMVAQR